VLRRPASGARASTFAPFTHGLGEAPAGACACRWRASSASHSARRARAAGPRLAAVAAAAAAAAGRDWLAVAYPRRPGGRMRPDRAGGSVVGARLSAGRTCSARSAHAAPCGP